MAEGWIADARAAFDAAYERDWQAHVRALNAAYGLTGDTTLLEVPTTPEFFWGDLGGFRPREWVAVISLNPQLMSADDLVWQQRQPWTPESLWAYLNRRDLREWKPKDFYYTKFARPLVLLAGAAVGDPDPLRDEVGFFMSRVGVFETMPYPSRVYRFSTDDALHLASTDVGCQASLGIALAAIRSCPPAAVLTNGLRAAEVLTAVAGWHWTEQRYPSVSRASKTLRHWEGTVESNDGPVPLFGLPHLRTQSSHNSNAEIAQLAERIAEVVHG
ncbi:MAG: hypothetical protein WC211_01705 [Dehalococcoidia bacterium]